MAAAMALDDGLAAAAFPSSPCAAAAARPMQDGPAWSTMSATQSAVSCSPTIGPDGESSIFPVPWVPERATVHCREPLVYTIDDFLSAREAEHFRTLAAPRLRRATVAADSHSDERRSFSENRTNRVTWLQRPDDTLRWVAKGTELLLVSPAVPTYFSLRVAPCGAVIMVVTQGGGAAGVRPVSSPRGPLRALPGHPLRAGPGVPRQAGVLIAGGPRAVTTDRQSPGSCPRTPSPLAAGCCLPRVAAGGPTAVGSMVM